jgi:cyclophilin family peptidyl-prolyl cis-trans isomerase
MKLIKFIVALSLGLTLSACFHTQLTGPVGGSKLEIAALRDPGSTATLPDSWDVEDWIKLKGQSVWDGYTPLFRLLVIGIATPDTSALDPSALYIVTANGGMDYHPDPNDELNELDDNPEPVQGSWHVIATGERITAGNLKVSALTEAIYQQILPHIDAYEDDEILARLEAAAQLLVADVTRDDAVTYDDVLAWNRTVSVEDYLGDLDALDQLAAAITAGQPQDMIAAKAEAVYGSHSITMVTSFGAIEMETLNWATPITAANFLGYVKDGFYDNVVFHRIINNFMIQTGAWRQIGADEYERTVPGAAILSEAVGAPSNLRGTVSMALLSGQPNSGTSGIFINQVNNSRLDHPTTFRGHTVFANVLSGMEVVDAIAALPTNDSDVSNPIVVIESVTINN